jgi:hydroxymethylpyrimidine/phosphomethylpyrimidine kinase
MNQFGELMAANHPVALTIAGSDPSGGAGLQADLKTFQQLGVYGASAVTLITVQNTRGVSRIQLLAEDLVLQQIDAVLSDIPPHAIKTGALGGEMLIRSIAKRLAGSTVPLIVDPVLVSKHGAPLADASAVKALREELLPLAFLVTPNRYELERLAELHVGDLARMRRAMERLHEAGAKRLLVKVGRAGGRMVHWLAEAGKETVVLETPWVQEGNQHGSGCTLAATIASLLALGHPDLVEICHQAIDRVWHAVASSRRFGQGISPVDHLALANGEPSGG